MTFLATRLTVSLAALASLAVAQEAEVPVQTLLRPSSRPSPDAVVTRAFARLESSDDYRSWHSVAGELHLLGFSAFGGWSEDDVEPRGILSEESLTMALSALGSLDESSIRIDHSGAYSVVRSDIPERVRVAVEAVHRSLPPRIRITATLERITPDGPVVVLRGDREVRNGETVTIAEIERQTVLRDFDVEIAQASATASPVLDDVFLGASIALRARPVPLRDEALVEAVIRTADALAQEPIQIHPSMGPLDRISTAIAECGTTFRIARGSSSRHEWTSHDGQQLRLTCKAEWFSMKPSNHDVQVICSSLLGAPVLGFPMIRHEDSDEPLESTAIVSMLENRLDEEPDGVLLFEAGDSAGGGCLIVEGDAGRAVAASVANLIDRSLTHVELAVEVLDVPRGAVVPASGEMPDGSRVIASIAAPAIAELSTSFAGVHERTYLARWGVEVAQASRIPDPEIDIVEEGYVATLRPMVGTSGRVESVLLSLQLLDLVDLRKSEVRINSGMAALASITDDSRPPAMWLEPDLVRIEGPVVRSHRIDTELMLDDAGRATTRSAAESLLGPNRDVVVRLRMQ